MSFARGRFGIEYNTIRTDDDSPGLMSWVLIIAFLLATVSLAVTLTARARRRVHDATLVPLETMMTVAEELRSDAATETPSGGETSGQTATLVADESMASSSHEPEMPPPEKLEVGGTAKRPAKVTNLLMRLDAAESAHDMMMAIETIEQLRSLPGNPAADLDDSLARRLGVLNMRRLLGSSKSPWTTEVIVKRGDTASRIAYEHGSTLASFARLNGGNIDKVVIGKKMRVMDHPRFSLVIHRLTKTADLSLNGKFFKRYYLKTEVKGMIGAYETPDRLRPFWTDKGISLDPDDRAELEMLMPRGSTILIAEL